MTEPTEKDRQPTEADRNLARELSRCRELLSRAITKWTHRRENGKCLETCLRCQANAELLAAPAQQQKEKS